MMERFLPKTSVECDAVIKCCLSVSCWYGLTLILVRLPHLQGKSCSKKISQRKVLSTSSNALQVKHEASALALTRFVDATISNTQRTVLLIHRDCRMAKDRCAKKEHAFVQYWWCGLSESVFHV